jgi:hypothetical protein
MTSMVKQQGVIMPGSPGAWSSEREKEREKERIRELNSHRTPNKTGEVLQI